MSILSKKKKKKILRKQTLKMCEGRKWWFEEAIKATILSHHFFPPEPSSLFQLRHFVLIFKAKASSEARVFIKRSNKYPAAGSSLFIQNSCSSSDIIYHSCHKDQPGSVAQCDSVCTGKSSKAFKVHLDNLTKSTTILRTQFFTISYFSHFPTHIQ